ncbi:MAG: proline--tRNA ligase [Thermoplasmatales archaeon]|nr:proline--tRNA ligase [Thermoplasmatales archaeon]
METEQKKYMLTAKKEEDITEWYTQVIINSEFVDYSAVSGMMVFRPDSYFAWDTLKEATDAMFKGAGVEDVYFPLFIPERFLLKESQHVEGFSPEVAWITHAGKSELSERLAVRPTSEAIMYDSFSRWIRSWRDLPIKYNIWASVVRWEFKHPTPLLRSREFLWNEGHSAFATFEEAEAEREVILGIYEKVLHDYLALPGIRGKKTDNEKFAGAVASYSIEQLMPDGWALQGPDHHSDGQNFAKAFDIGFVDKDGSRKYVYQNTYAITTRELGAMVLCHGDNKGLVIPPKLARIQIVLVPIFNNIGKEEVLTYSRSVFELLKKSFRTHLDDRDEYTPGWKYNEWEIKGIPIRIEIGKREIESKSVTAVRRDTGKKENIKVDQLTDSIKSLLEEIHSNLYTKALKFLESHTFVVKDYEELKKHVGKGMIQAAWCGSAECETKVKEETGAKITNLPSNAQDRAKGEKCIYCGKEAKHIANFAKSY